MDIFGQYRNSRINTSVTYDIIELLTALQTILSELPIDKEKRRDVGTPASFLSLILSFTKCISEEALLTKRVETFSYRHRP